MFSILSPQDGHRETPRASQKVVPEQGERAVVKLQVDRLVAVEVVGQQPVAVLAARRTQVGAEAGPPTAALFRNAVATSSSGATGRSTSINSPCARRAAKKSRKFSKAVTV